MKMGLYSIKDAKTGFMTPVLEQGDAAALRNFSHAVNQPDSIMYAYPNDFSLFKLAHFDTDKGIEPVANPVLIVDASEVLRNG
nr:MAG TPA: DNA binding protein [Microviridae sp.]